MSAPYILVTPGFLRPMRAFETVIIRISVRNGDPDEPLELELSGITGGINSLLTRSRTLRCTERDASRSPSIMIRIHALRSGEPRLIIRSPRDRFAKATIISDHRTLIALPPSPGDITLDQEDEEPITQEFEDEDNDAPAQISVATASAEIVQALSDQVNDETLGGHKRFERDLERMRNDSGKSIISRPLLIAALVLIMLIPLHVVPTAHPEPVPDQHPTPEDTAPPERPRDPEPEPVVEETVVLPESCVFHQPSMHMPTARSPHEQTKGQYIVRCDDNKLYTASLSQKINGYWVHTGLRPYTQ